MMFDRSRDYPEESVGGFPAPPATFEDREGRELEVRALDETDEADVDALVEMYTQFHPEDRAQGIPPSGEKRIRDWLEPIFAGGVNVVVWHGDELVGHATLVPEVDAPDPEEFDDIEWELAIFVLREYQGAGIGTTLLEHLLGYASEQGIETVWLTVERWNNAAIAVYETVGFEICGSESFEQEMVIVLES